MTLYNDPAVLHAAGMAYAAAFAADPVLRPMPSRPAKSAKHRAWDKLEDAIDGYVFDNGRASHHQADEHVLDGYALAEASLAMPEDDREDWLEDQFGKSEAPYLIACAASYRLEEIAAEAGRAAA